MGGCGLGSVRGLNSQGLLSVDSVAELINLLKPAGYVTHQFCQSVTVQLR